MFASEPLSKQRIVDELHRAMQVQGYNWKRELFFQRHENEDVTAMFLEVRKLGHVFTLIPRWEAYNTQFAQMMRELSGISLRPLRHAITGEAFWARMKLRDPQRLILIQRYHCVQGNLGVWRVQTERNLYGKARKIADAFMETGEQYRAATRTLEDVAARVVYWPKDGPYPSMPARYTMLNRNMLRLIALHILGERKTMMEEFDYMRSYIKRTTDPVYKRRHEVFVQRFAEVI